MRNMCKAIQHASVGNGLEILMVQINQKPLSKTLSLNNKMKKGKKADSISPLSAILKSSCAHWSVSIHGSLLTVCVWWGGEEGCLLLLRTEGLWRLVLPDNSCMSNNNLLSFIDTCPKSMSMVPCETVITSTKTTESPKRIRLALRWNKPKPQL